MIVSLLSIAYVFETMGKVCILRCNFALKLSEIGRVLEDNGYTLMHRHQTTVNLRSECREGDFLISASAASQQLETIFNER